MSKKKRRKQHEGPSPAIPIAPDDLRAIDDILSGYIAYVQKNGQGSAQMREKIHGLQDIHSRILFLRQGGEGVTAVITRNDILAIREAMVAFVHVIRRTIPQSSKRDETLTLVNRLRKSLEKHLLC